MPSQMEMQQRQEKTEETVSDPVAEQAERQTDFSALPPRPLGRADDESPNTEGSLLNDPRLSKSHRRSMAIRISRLYGNRQLQRAIGLNRYGTTSSPIPDEPPTSQDHDVAQGPLTAGGRVRERILQRRVVRNDAVSFTYTPEGRLPDGIVVDMSFPREADQGRISRDLIIALRRWVMTQEEDRAPDLVNAPAFQAQLRVYLDGYRVRNRPTIRGQWEYRIYIQLSRDDNPATRHRVNSIAIDTRRHPPIPRPEEPTGPSREERRGWVDRALADESVSENEKRMLRAYREGTLDGLYQVAPRIDAMVQNSALTPADVEREAADANDDITNGVDHALDYDTFKIRIREVRRQLLRGVERIHFHDSEGAPTTTLDANADMIHEWIWARQSNPYGVYGIFYPVCSDRGFR